MESRIIITAIVKNESEKIQETLIPFVEAGFTKILIVDTGSDDNTCQKISELSKDIIIGHCEFKNYSYARNIALSMCREEFEESDFIFMIDCEWYVSQLDNLKIFCLENKDKDFDYFEVNLLMNNKICNPMRCLFRTKGNSKYEGDLHEIANGLSGGLVPNFIINCIQTEYGLNKTRERNINFDIPYYLSKIERTNSETFYLAQAYHNIKDYDNAILYYKELIEKESNLYICYYRIAEILFVNNDYESAILYYFKAITINPRRCEPYVRLSQLFYFKNKYELAKLAYQNSSIPNNEIFIEIDCYNYYRYLELIRGCIAVKKYKEGIKILYEYCNDNNISLNDVSDELKFYKNLLKRRIVILILTSPGYEEYNKIMFDYLSNFDIEFYFYSYCESDFSITNHNINFKGQETFIPGILNKTINVFSMFSEYDYIMRINATTFVDMTKVEFGCENYNMTVKDATSKNGERQNFDYYGYLNSTSLDENIKYGVTKEFLEKNGSIPFVSGKCIILSNKAINKFLSNGIDRTVMDDISIALSLREYKIDHINSFSDYVNNKSVITICSSPEIMKECIEMNGIQN